MVDAMTNQPRARALRHLSVIAVSIVALLGGCGDGESATDATTTTASPAAAEPVDLSAAEFEDLTDQTEVAVQAVDNSFRSEYIIVKAGTTVTWTNKGRTEHNVLPADDGAFEPIEVQDLEPGMSASITFDEAGDYPYYCSLRGTRTKGMLGAVRVVA